MIFLSDFTPISETKVRFKSIHYMPFDEIEGLNKTQEELEAEGILVESLPDINAPEGQRICGRFVNPQTKEVWYEYEPLPLTKEEQLQAQIDEISIAMAAILGGAE
ncbi:MAG: hypothetical protein BWY15_00414 [Firmicutes bacterium ADurb.Bin193]|nr:MAG: hypothetical protein BWY15_00414 [Firmicutes bacterium ADurb.Bin193]